MDESAFENGQEIATNDGILMRRGPASFLAEISNKTTGTLSLVHHVDRHSGATLLCIEWKPNDFLIADADTQENGDWSLVDTIAKRRRTPSESLAFEMPPPAQQQPQQQQQHHAKTGPRLLRVPITELHHIAVAKKNHILQLVRRHDVAGSVHSEYFFQHGNAEGFVRGLQTTHCLRRNARAPDQYDIVDNVQPDKEKLQKTFAELRIDDIKGAGGTGGWLSSMVRDPFTHTLGLLAKMSDAYTVLPGAAGPSDSAADGVQQALRAKRAAQRRERYTSGGSMAAGERHSVSSVGSPGAAVIDEYDMLSNAGSSPGRPGDVGPATSAEGAAATLNGRHHQSIVDDLDEMPVLGDRTLPRRPSVERSRPMTGEEFAAFVQEDGRIADVEAVRRAIFRGGIANDARREIWPFLLGLKRWDETTEQRQRTLAQKTSEYFKMKMQWLSMTAVQERNFVAYQMRKCQIEKDVCRTDRSIAYFEGEQNRNVGRLQDILMTYVMYNFDLGYVQGMSDLLAPILVVMDDEVESFWCFVGFMDMVCTNFDMDQGGMKHQLRDLHELLSFSNPRLFDYFLRQQSDNMYVCFRWLLVWFKREFSYYDIMALWECMWTRLPCVNFQLLICVAILDAEQDTIMDGEFEFNDILKYVNELAYKLDYQAILRRAEAIYLQIRDAEHLTDKVRAIIGEELRMTVADEAAMGASGAAAADEELDGFDNIPSPVKSLREMEEDQRKIEEACQRSMYNSFY